MVTSRAAHDKEARDADRAADCAWKCTRKQKSKVDRNDGLHCNEVLAGTMLLPDLSNSDDAIGKMDHVCQFCCAMKFRLETPNLCCNSGHIVVDPVPRVPQQCMTLYRPETDRDVARSKVFVKNIRSLNNGLCLSSLKINYQMFSNYTPTVIIQG